MFVRRLANAMPILLIVSLITFAMMPANPGDPAITGSSATLGDRL
jgi:ABC-type dipeptide/oligopeptide/nickel transport system permease component